MSRHTDAYDNRTADRRVDVPGIAFGWSDDGHRHLLPGRLRVAVDGLMRNAHLGGLIVRQVAGQPGVRRVAANPWTGRVLVTFAQGQVTPCELERLILLAAGAGQVAAGREPMPVAGVSTGETPGAAPEPPAGTAWHALPLEALIRTLDTATPRGLPEVEAARRLELFGPNQLRAARQAALSEVVLRQLKNPITLLLLGAGGVSLAVAQWLEGIAALGIAGVTTYMAVRQESRATHALGALSKLAAPRAVVVRGGRPLALPAELVVPGELIILEEGDRVPADARLVFSAALQVDESALTGESCPAVKDPALHCCSPATPLADRHNMVYAGTVVTSGRAQALVVATGMATEVGKVAALLEEGSREVTPLQRRLQQLARWMFWGILGIGAAGTAMGVARGLPLGAALAQSVSVAVSAMPQGLPVTVTIALSTAVTRLAEQGAMTRRLGAMESLGATTVICTDKTGTITCNRLSVREVQVAGARWALGNEADLLRDGAPAVPDGPLIAALEAAALCNNARLVGDGAMLRAEGDATEGALLLAARRVGIDPTTLQAKYPRLHETPFSAGERRMSVVCQTDGGPALYVKGAPETVLPMCSRWLGPSGGEALTGAARREQLAAAEAMAARGMRVLALAWRPQDQPVFPAANGFIFLGFAGMVDAPRPGAQPAIARCREAGIRVLMLTGDHPATAAAVAREVGILGPAGLVLTGPQLDAMTDSELAAAADQLAVCARVAPEHKLRVVRILKGQGHVVAMTGDGVNDAPALQAADTGIAMGIAGTDVTRGAANLVLTDDDFTAIVMAVEQGRSAYANIRRALTYSLTTNGGEALMALLPLAVGLALPVPAAMLLITNMLCDGLVSLSLATDQPEPGVMARPPRPLGEPVLGRGTVGAVAVRGAAIGLSTVGLYTAGLAMTGLPAVGYSMALAGLVAAKLCFAWQVRRRSLDGSVVAP
ncbi:MAG: hypothetical protein JWN15_712, partial [Firmicutes bacterium]|nr:hypothetical protein [Bacillota bacterium]